MEQLALSWEPERRIYTVKSLTAEMRALLAERFADIWVAGEISGARLAASGHYYFTLKDGEAQLRCACFRPVARYLKFKPQDGIEVLARGRIDVYEARGEYQLLVEALEPRGAGALQLAFEQLKKKLAAEGLFDPARKRPLPKLPRRIGIVTSPTGAVIRDMLNVLGRRFPGLHIRLYPAQVQGEGSVEQVVRGIEYFGQSGWPEVLIVARGGGSLEDLWTFNEEAVARAIAACPVPVISAVGHETDFTIADFAADLRAPTPSAAAELVVPTRDSLAGQIAAGLDKLARAMRYRLARAALRLEQQGLGRATAVFSAAWDAPNSASTTWRIACAGTTSACGSPRRTGGWTRAEAAAGRFMALRLERERRAWTSCTRGWSSSARWPCSIAATRWWRRLKAGSCGPPRTRPRALPSASVWQKESSRRGLPRQPPADRITPEATMQRLLTLIFGAAAVFAAGYWLGHVHTVYAQNRRVFELRTYHTVEGRLDALHARFRDHTMKLFEKHGITNIGYFSPQDPPLAGKTLVYLIAHPSREAAKKNFDAFRQDPAWIKAREESEKSGKIVEKVESVFLDPADFSPMK